MTNTSSDNKRIAKNTLMLYTRMMLTLIIGVYTSRVILSTLGMSDYGLYNVVGGFVSMLTFLNGTLQNGTQRFLSFHLGENNIEKLKVVFSTALQTHFFLALVIFIFAETIGLWFVETQLNIETGRESAAFWVYQFSVFTLMVSVFQVPFMSALIAHQKMDIYAYVSIFESIAKLLIIYFIQTTTCDKLIIYAMLIFVVQIMCSLAYNCYSQYKYEECSLSFRYDKTVLKEISKFSGWSVIGMTACTLNGQGINVLLNTFFGTIVNAARGISAQVNAIVNGFVFNFQTASKPQIIKLFAEGRIKEMEDLAINTAKYSAFLLIVLIVPLIIEIRFILSLWLGEYPDQTPTFIIIILLQSLIQSMSNPIVTVTMAKGKIKETNLTAGVALLLVFPISYILLKLGASAELVLCLNIVAFLLEAYIDSFYAQKYTGFSQRRFYIDVYLKVIIVMLASFIPPFLLKQVIGWDSIGEFILVVATSLLCSVSSFLYLGINKRMRGKIYTVISQKIQSTICKR